jgi:hypothetical protein
MKTNFMPNETHKENSKLANKGLKKSAPAWQARRWKIRLEQNEAGEWWVYINDGPTGLPASDVEVSLWLELQEVKEALEKREAEIIKFKQYQRWIPVDYEPAPKDIDNYGALVYQGEAYWVRKPEVE